MGKVFKEMKKCVYLCCRCHRELHAGLIKNDEVENIYVMRWKKIIENFDNELTEKKYYCKNCGKERNKNLRNTICSVCSNRKRRKVKDRPSKEQLLKEIEETNYCIVGRKYDVSDNAIRKWIK